MDFAIAPAIAAGDSHGWDVVYLLVDRGAERALRLASFGYRDHAEAFLEDLLTGEADPHHG